VSRTVSDIFAKVPQKTHFGIIPLKGCWIQTGVKLVRKIHDQVPRGTISCQSEASDPVVVLGDEVAAVLKRLFTKVIEFQTSRCTPIGCQAIVSLEFSGRGHGINGSVREERIGRRAGGPQSFPKEGFTGCPITELGSAHLAFLLGFFCSYAKFGQV
jgi:hypothetical protein